MVRFAKETDADLTIATLPVNESEAKRMGIMKINQQQMITDFYEKPQEQQILQQMESFTGEESPFLASMGIYLFKREALIDLLKKDLREDFGQHLIPTKVAEGSVAAFQYDGYWEEIVPISSQ